jgi:hypothetical protein
MDPAWLVLLAEEILSDATIINALRQLSDPDQAGKWLNFQTNLKPKRNSNSEVCLQVAFQTLFGIWTSVGCFRNPWSPNFKQQHLTFYFWYGMILFQGFETELEGLERGIWIAFAEIFRQHRTSWPEH